MKITEKLYKDLFNATYAELSMKTIKTLFKVNNFIFDNDYNLFNLFEAELVVLENNIKHYLKNTLILKIKVDNNEVFADLANINIINFTPKKFGSKEKTIRYFTVFNNVLYDVLINKISKIQNNIINLQLTETIYENK